MNCQKGPTTSATLSSPDSKRDGSRTIQTILPNSSPNASQSQIKPESWKLMENPPGFDPKQRCFRILGICKEWPKYTIKQVVDPRKKNRYWIPREDDLEVPDFWIDDEYCAIPPRREIAVTGLNDNINENLLTEYCSKIGCIPLELHLYRHPKTNEHLRMALIDFKTKTESQKFISSYDQKPIMGSKLTCFFDTFAYKLSELYKAQTGKESEYLPKRYGGVFNSNTIENIRRKIQQESLAAQLDKLPEIAPEKNGDFIDSCISTEAAVLKAFRTNVAFEKNKNESSPYYLPPPPLPPSTPHLKNGFRLAISPSPYSSPSQTKRPRQDFSGSTKRNYQHSNNRNNLSFKANHLSPNNLNNKRDHYSHKRTETSSQRCPKPDSSFQQRKDTKSAEIIDKQFCSSEPGTSTTEASKLPGPIPTIIKSSDIPKYVKNSLRIDLVIKLQQDIDKKIQTEMLKHLNELWHEKEQKRQIELSTNGPPSLPPALTTEPFFQYGGKFPPAAYGLNTISIFGMPYYERIANMPKIRKKPQLNKITETKATRISVLKKRSGLEQEPSQIGFSRSRSIGSISQRSDAETEKGDESICTRSRSSSTESHSSSSSLSSASTQTEFSKTPSLVAGGDNEIQPSSFHMNDETCIKTELKDFDTGSDQSKKAYSPIPDIDSFSFEVSSYNEHIKQISKLQILPPKIWAKRNDKEESNVLYKHLEVGFNNEECKYLKQALANMERKFNIGTECVIPKLIDNAKPSPVEMPTLPCKIENKEYYYADSELDGVIPHKSGCARAEGYYKVSQKTKSMMRRYEHSDTRNIISTHDENTARQISQALKNERAMNRGLVDIAASSSLCSVNQLKYRAKMIKFARSRIHGWGLYALQTIAPDEMIIEYVGEKIRPSVSDNRERDYETRGMGSSYMFRIDDDAVVDATMKGNFARFINHSCTPNCYAKILPVSRDKRIVIYSKRTIQKGEEITYDYKFPIEDDKIPCLCGSVQCRGSLN